ncbi:FAD-dependent oxidoreductase [Agreia sp. VKM Ac-1783]|uniref:NAD(P)/FAD-dependent oxidoreductase n=1 Tax=Agreia sp. VKM Ac-1783 TaxID=1938889 RepID=UPI000A2AE35C|nr:FAD-dependent oxidoreductase [Agreia sp. VKM Ac-1783]SMQ74220.1 Glycine/D-amino acid oxidase [Agreia sp. VKM Ac-1783]
MGDTAMENGKRGYWLNQADIEWPDVDGVENDEECDVAIVGGGLTGLWTAWALKTADPKLSVHVYEAESFGYGASGRNGGWLSAKTVGIRSQLAKGPGGRHAVMEVDDQLRSGIDEIVDLLGRERINARKGGWLQVARSDSEQARIEHYVEKSRSWGVAEKDLRLLSATEAEEHVRISHTTGAIYSQHGYTVDPARMMCELMMLAISAGVVLRAPARASEIGPGQLRVGRHTIRARWIVVATEGYTARERGQRRAMLPLNSSLLVTEPLTPREWESIGWGGHAGASGSAHTYFYARPTVDRRIALGGRGKPYQFASSFDPSGKLDEGTVQALLKVVHDLFPEIAAKPAHAWSGILGVHRDWSPTIAVDENAKILRVGGYAGSGVTAAYLAGKIAADIVLDRRTSLSRSPWVRQLPAKWEPEPLRWLGANALYAIYGVADGVEARRGGAKTSSLALLADKLARRG